MMWFGKSWPEVSTDEIRKRARILVVDDSEFYYLPLFEKDGYTIDKWNDVDDLQKVENGYYDVILLDIQGVGKTQSKDQGLGILRHLRKVSPAQLIIAYSNADFSLQYKEFFDLADATLHKSADYVDFKRKVDELLERRFSLGFYLDRIVKVAGQSPADSERLRSAAEKSILKRNPKYLAKVARQLLKDQDTISNVLQIAQIAIGILELWRG